MELNSEGIQRYIIRKLSAIGVCSFFVLRLSLHGVVSFAQGLCILWLKFCMKTVYFTVLPLPLITSYLLPAFAQVFTH